MRSLLGHAQRNARRPIGVLTRTGKDDTVKLLAIALAFAGFTGLVLGSLAAEDLSGRVAWSAAALAAVGTLGLFWVGM